MAFIQGERKEEKRGVRFVIFLLSSQPADRKQEGGRGCCHQHRDPVLWCGSISEAASSKEDEFLSYSAKYQCLLVNLTVDLWKCVYMYECVDIMWMKTPTLLIKAVMSTIQVSQERSAHFCFSCWCNHIFTVALKACWGGTTMALFHANEQTSCDSLWICISKQSAFRQPCSLSIWISTSGNKEGRELVMM